MNWKPEVEVEGKFYPNGLVFATEDEAKGSARSTFQNWMLATGHRAVESSDEVNATWDTVTGLTMLPTKAPETEPEPVDGAAVWEGTPETERAAMTQAHVNDLMTQLAIPNAPTLTADDITEWLHDHGLLLGVDHANGDWVVLNSDDEVLARVA